MRSKTQRSAGRHRKITTSQTAKGRIAVVTVAAGAVSTAGVGGAAAGTIQSGGTGETKTQSIDYTLQTDTDPLKDIQTSVEDAAPQILAIAESKPVEDLSAQLDKAIQAADARAAADEANRAPSVARPAEGVFTSGFGTRWGSFHSGIDIANAVGTPILSVMDGTVIDSGPASGFGQWIRIKHDDGSMSVYGHMQTLDVAVGERVHAGQKIAGMGSEGFSTGSHLHFEIHPTGEGAVDPIPWLAERGVVIS
ncbi:M23 family metallopeptidase [Corynebacterium singulare]|uniref:M23 family metallopeptidase n=1 Tax=Corynebacterium singulare TaxID=161899 RepID=A0ABS9PTL0_9CORY|nr:M23 family metallopeptidase [Corynebacterium singulare]MCG7276051.1 M23 family metallopeptidase [Corynebacterium singulare]